MNNKLSSNGTLKNIIQVLILSFVVFPLYALAQQETGQIIGTVIDQNGAAIPNASVTVKSVDRGNEVSIVTNSDGTYLVTNLQPGLYNVTIKAQGFQDKTERTQVTVGAKLTVNTQLGVVGTSGNVVDIVAGGVAEINTTDQQLSSVVTTKQILELPTLTRNPYDLVALSGNISDGDPGGSTGRGVGASINGQRSSSTDILLDGVENVDTFVAGIGQQTPLDSVGEFRVITSNFSAENGRASGGIVNAVTKSGTNEFHGTAYEFNRNSKFATNSFDNNANNAPRANFNRNQFGYSVGGPILKNRLFFFNSTEWTRVRSQDTLRVYVPTAAFINASSINTRNFFSRFGTLASNVTPTGRTFLVDPRVGGGNTPLFQEVSFSIPADAGGGFPTNSYSTVTRIDYNLSDKTQIFGRYALENNKPFTGNYDVSPYQGFTVGTTSINQNVLLSLTQQFSSKLVSQTKIAYSRQTGKNTVGADPSTPTLTGNFGGPNGLPIYFPGFLSTQPGAGLPTSGTQHFGQVNEDANYTAGNHNIRFGGQFIYIQDNKTFPAFQNALETLGANSTTVINNFLLGRLTSFQAAINPQGRFPGQTISTPIAPPDFSRSNRYSEYAFYGNDSWRISPRLTLNFGLRYEFYGVQHNKNPAVESNFFFGSGSTFQERIRNGSVKTTTQSGGLWNPDKNNLAPRLGIAWDVFGDGKTSVRGGYGIAYERNFGNVTFNVIQNPPSYAVLGITPADTGGTLPIFTTSAGPLAGAGITRTLPRVTLRAVDPNIKNAYTEFYSASVEREIINGTVASISYSGALGKNLYSIANINRAGSGQRFLNSNATNCPGLTSTDRLTCQYGNINFRGNEGYSKYNGFTFALDSNNLFGQGLTLTNRYTFAHSKDNLSSTFSDGYQGNFVLGFLDPFNPSLDYGDSDFDTRHRFVSSFIWDVPFGKKIENGAVKKVLDGFQITGRVNIQSGTPFTVYDCTNASLTTCVRLTPTGPLSFKAPGKLLSTGNPNGFIYTDLRNQRVGTFSDVSGGTEVGPYPTDLSPRNSFRGPGSWNVDLGFLKNVDVTERFRIQLRAEAFNVFNHANLAINSGSLDISSSIVDPNLDFNDPVNTATRYVTASKTARRNLQFAIKFIF